MKFVSYLFYFRLSIVVFAAAFVLVSLVVSHRFAKSVAEEEHKKVELWAEAIKILTQSEFEQGVNFEFIHKVVESNTAVPCILVDEAGAVLSTKNVNPLDVNTREKLAKRLRSMEKVHPPLEIHIPDEGAAFMYYGASRVQRMLLRFPLAQLVAAALFLLLVTLVVGISKSAEQNHVWAGMAKETAHQLGTPVSSLLGWTALLKDKEPAMAQELEKDVARLEKISTRFSKIGAKDNLQPVDVVSVARSCMDYMRRRTPRGVDMVDATNGLSATARVNATLWEWVVENLLKNALDAVGGGRGTVTVSAQATGKKIVLDVSDSGRGIPQGLHRKIFTPGYTTKTRGWGIGLSLCRRIVEGSCRGKIYVLSSAPGRGTTMRVVLKADSHQSSVVSHKSLPFVMLSETKHLFIRFFATLRMTRGELSMTKDDRSTEL